VTSCVGSGSQKVTYVQIPDKYLKDCEQPLAKGFGYKEVLKWGVKEAESIEKCNAQLEEARKLNSDAAKKNQKKEEKKWYQFWR